jgi:hypothetical protein
MKNKNITLVLSAMLCILSFNLACAEEDLKTQDLGLASADNTAVESEPALFADGALDSEPEIQWILGKVISLDLNAKSLLIRYSDYDTDEDKDILIDIDQDTSYDNVKSLDQIKAQDSLSVDYIVTAEGKNIARNISLEKIEAQGISREETGED